MIRIMLLLEHGNFFSKKKGGDTARKKKERKGLILYARHKPGGFQLTANRKKNLAFQKKRQEVKGRKGKLKNFFFLPCHRGLFTRTFEQTHISLYMPNESKFDSSDRYSLSIQ